MSAECEVCATPFHINVCNPRLLRCGHTICGSCVAHLIKIRSFFCPFCRASCRSIKSENELPLNRFILDLVEKENTDNCDNNNVNNCLKNLDKSGINESNSTVIPSSFPVVHAGVCQEHGYYRDMRCTSCNISICKQCTYCDHPQNTCRVIPITKANLENHVRFRAKEKSHAVMHNCKYITDNLSTRLPRLEAAAKRQAKAVESLQSELEFQQSLQKEVDDHVANMKDVLQEGQKRQEVLQRTQQYLEDLENAQNKTTEVDNNCEKEDDGNKENIFDTSCQTSINEAQSSVINCSLSVEESSIVNISNKTEETNLNSVKCCDSSTSELENALNHLDIKRNNSVNISDNPEEITSHTTNVNTFIVPQNSENIMGNTSNESQISLEQINEQATPTIESTTEQTNDQATPMPESMTEQINSQAIPIPESTTEQTNSQTTPMPESTTEQTNSQATPIPESTTEQTNSQTTPMPESTTEQTNSQATPMPESTTEQTNSQATPMPESTTEQTNSQATPIPESTTEQTNSQATPMPESTSEQTISQATPMPESMTEQTNNPATSTPDSTTEQSNNQASSTPDSMTEGTLPHNNSKTDITQVQIMTLEDVQKIQKETEHFIQASQYLPWNRTASKLKKTQAIVFHAVELLDLCRTTQGYAPLVDGFLDDDYESEESEDDYDYDDENNGGEEEDADHTSEDEDDDFSDDGVVVVETLDEVSEEDKSAHQNHSQTSQEQQLLTYNDKRYPILRTLLVPFSSLFSSFFSAFNGFKEMMTLPQLLDPHADEKDNLYIDQLFL